MEIELTPAGTVQLPAPVVVMTDLGGSVSATRQPAGSEDEGSEKEGKCRAGEVRCLSEWSSLLTRLIAKFLQ